MIAQSTLFKRSGSCRGAGQVTGCLCVTWPSQKGPEKSEYPDAPDYVSSTAKLHKLQTKPDVVIE